MVKGYLKKGVRLLFRADAVLPGKDQARGVQISGSRGCGLRHKTSRQPGVARAYPALAGPPYRMAVGEAHCLLSRFRLPGPELGFASASSGQEPALSLPKGGMAPGRAISQGWVHRDRSALSTQRHCPLLQWAWHRRTVDPRVERGRNKGGEVRAQLNAAFLPQVRCQPGEAVAVHPGLQPGELREKAGIAGVGEALVAQKCPDKADQDRRKAGAPCEKVGVSACRSDYDQGCVQRGTGADKQTPPTIRIIPVLDLGVDLK